MAYSARFTLNQEVFPIQREGNYGFHVDRDWTPPSINPAYILAQGSSFNKWGGSSVISDGGTDVKFSVPIVVFGSTYDHQINQVRRLASFIKKAKYFECKYSTLPTPSWGQHGAFMRYEIVTADISTDDSLNNSQPPARRVYVQLLVKPRFYGQSQSILAASGGLFEDTIGTGDGSSKGVRIPSTTINKMTNPVFSNATWNTGWTEGAAQIESQNVDPAYCYPGAFNSAKITYKSGAGSVYFQNINAGNTNKHALSALIYWPPDTAPTSSDMVLYYDGSNQTTTFVSQGNHVYLLYSDNITGHNGATATGINSIGVASTYYLMAMQFEEKVYHTPICHGDMAGCVWTGGGTRGGATTTRTAAYMDDLFVSSFIRNHAAGAVEVIWIPDLDQAKSNSNNAHMISGTNAVKLYFKYADAKWYLTDNVNTISSAAQTFATGDRLHLVATWGAGGLNIYKNGVNIATGATYTPVGNASSIGTNATDFAGGIFASYTMFNTEVTAAHALALYADTVNDTRSISPVPYTFTLDGGNIIYQGTTAAHSGAMAISGIPGNLQARTTYNYIISAATAPDAGYLSLQPIPYGDFVDPRYEWFYDLNGTADAGVSVGGGYTSYTTGNYPTGLSVYNTRLFPGKHNFFIRLRRSATTETVSITPRIYRGYQNINGDATSCAITTTHRLFHLGSIAFEASTTSQNPMWLRAYERYLFTAVFNATGTVQVDYITDLPGDIVKFITPDLSDGDSIFYENGKAVFINSSLDSGELTVRESGSIDLYPNRINMLTAMIGENAGQNDDADYIRLWIDFEPCWSLI